jgi:GT2 family glycosyltransferase
LHVVRAPGHRPPAASIVIATFNRPQVLDYAIRSVLQSTFDDWELIVVGDGCTDGTEALVRSFGDPRISWHNLPENSGNQAAPNNAGAVRARGRYLFFLNHDDMWFADHLGGSIDFLERTGADVAFSPVALLDSSGRDSGPPDPQADTIVLDGVAPGGYDPRVFVIASSWAIRRSAYDRVGPWHSPETTRLSPSQEWLFRAARAECRIVYEPRVSIICIHAGTRRLSYLRPSPEHERVWDWVRGSERPGADLLEAIAICAAADAYRKRGSMATAAGVSGWIGAGVTRVAERFGAHPHAVERFLRRQPKGGWIAAVHRRTFAALPLSPGEQVTITHADGRGYLVSGWHGGESWGVWSAAARAMIGFQVPRDVRDPVLEVTGGPLRRPGEVALRVDDQLAVRHTFTSYDETVRVALGAGGERDVILTIEVDEAASPKSLGISEDVRSLGFALAGLRLVDRGAEPVGTPA